MISSARRVYADDRRLDMQKIRSRDGTLIAFDRVGAGPPLILVVGAFNTRETGAPLAAYLASDFTVLAYDRRGRGDSGDTTPYAVEREIEDLEAVIGAAGDRVACLGYSSGAVLALRASRSASVSSVVLYDLPPAQPAHHATELESLVDAGRRGDAVEYFQRELVRIPDPVIAQFRHAPFRPALERMAHTLVYDATLLREEERSALPGVPTLAIVGAESPPVMRDVAESLVRSLPDGRSLVLDGAGHDLVPATVGPILRRFLAR
jgi:pimeloyl-ACP methyl ester carboxylesterase